MPRDDTEPRPVPEVRPPVETLRDELQAHAVKMTNELRVPYLLLVHVAEQDAEARQVLALIEPLLKECSFLAGAAALLDDGNAVGSGVPSVITALAQIGMSIDAVINCGYGAYGPCQLALERFCEAEARDNLALLHRFEGLPPTRG